jgi:hypothetical protein
MSRKSVVLSLPGPPCRPLPLSENDYESEGPRFESCRAHLNVGVSVLDRSYAIEVRGFSKPGVHRFTPISTPTHHKQP